MALPQIFLLAALLVWSGKLKSESTKSKIVLDILRRTIASQQLESFKRGTLGVDINFRRADLHRYGDLLGWNIAIMDSLYQDMQLYNGVRQGMINVNVYDTSAFTLSNLFQELYLPGVMYSQGPESDSAATIIIAPPVITGWGQLDILEEMVIDDADSDFVGNKHNYIYFNKQYDSSVLHIPVIYTKRVKEKQVDLITFIYDYRVFMNVNKDSVEYKFIKKTSL